jgi:lipoprotein-anchoring transpeptidase ErfK/SrfK
MVIRKVVVGLLLFSLMVAPVGAAAPIAEGQYPISIKELQIYLDEIQQLIQRGDWLEARNQYKTLLQYDLSSEDQELVDDGLQALNMKLLFSPTISSTSIQYEVQPGDSLSRISRKYKTTIELLRKSNYITGDLIRPGQKLKVTQATFSIRVNKAKNELTLYANDDVVKVYPVATGSGTKTPIGTFTIENKLVDPVWYHKGAVVPSESPENILGTRWLGISIDGYGIHGTRIPESIGTNVTLGCVRMYNKDVEELFSIVPLKTKVTIVE